MERYIIGLGTITVLIVISSVWHWHFGGARLFRLMSRTKSGRPEVTPTH
jgi:hypothetical protein